MHKAPTADTDEPSVILEEGGRKKPGREVLVDRKDVTRGHLGGIARCSRVEATTGWLVGVVSAGQPLPHRHCARGRVRILVRHKAGIL
eukprot:5324974-Alexandrium_andersonii.AAC.1